MGKRLLWVLFALAVFLAVGCSLDPGETHSPPSNTPPVATFAVDPISGTLEIGQTLTVQYTYSDADGDAQDLAATTYAWLRYDTAAPTGGTVIPGATGATYTTTDSDSGKWLRVEVTPVDDRGGVGATVLSDPVQVYTHLVIDTFYPNGGGLSDTYLILIDAAGNVLAQDDNGNPDQTTHDGYSRIDCSAGLPAGTYYVRVNNDTGTGSPYYGIRAVDYDPGSNFPVLGTVNEADGGSDDPVDGNGVPTNPVPLSLGEAGAQSRAILPIAVDKDWFELVLP